MTKKLLFTLAAMTMLTVSCGDDKKDDKDDDKKDGKESSETKPETAAELDLCGCVDATIEAYGSNGEIPEELESKCEELFESTANAQDILQDCPNFGKLMTMSREMSEAAMDELEGEEYSSEDVSCDELLEEYESFMIEYKEVSEAYAENQQDAAAISEYMELSQKAAKFSTSFAGSDCLMNEEFNAQIEAINEEYGPKQ